MRKTVGLKMIINNGSTGDDCDDGDNGDMNQYDDKDEDIHYDGGDHNDNEGARCWW